MFSTDSNKKRVSIVHKNKIVMERYKNSMFYTSNLKTSFQEARK